MSFLLLRLRGPMQAWGTRSRFEYRDTEREPTFSGIIGIIAAAEGLPRGADLSEYNQLVITVRVDREGELDREFQTALDVVKASGGTETQIIHRDFLADAAFHVAVEGPDSLIKRIFIALHRPRYPLFLGRKSYLPSVPIVYPGKESYIDTDKDALTFLCGLPLATDFAISRDELIAGDNTKKVRFVVPHTDSSVETRQDIPRNFDIYRRRYDTRYIKTEYRSVPVADSGQEAGHET